MYVRSPRFCSISHCLWGEKSSEQCKKYFRAAESKWQAAMKASRIAININLQFLLICEWSVL